MTDSTNTKRTLSLSSLAQSLRRKHSSEIVNNNSHTNNTGNMSNISRGNSYSSISHLPHSRMDSFTSKPLPFTDDENINNQGLLSNNDLSSNTLLVGSNQQRSRSQSPNSRSLEVEMQNNSISSSPVINMFDKSANKSRVRSPRRMRAQGPRPYSSSLPTNNSPLMNSINSVGIDSQFEQLISKQDIPSATKLELLSYNSDQKLAMLKDIEIRNSAKKLYASASNSLGHKPHSSLSLLPSVERDSFARSSNTISSNSLSRTKSRQLEENTLHQARLMAEELAQKGQFLPGRASLARESRYTSHTSIFKESNNITSLDAKFSSILDHAKVSDAARSALMKLDVARKIDLIDQYYVQKDLSKEKRLARIGEHMGQRPLQFSDIESVNDNSIFEIDTASTPRMSTATLNLQQKAEEYGTDRMFSKLLDTLNIYGGSRDVMMKLSPCQKKTFLEQYFYIKDQLNQPSSNSKPLTDIEKQKIEPLKYSSQKLLVNGFNDIQNGRMSMISEHSDTLTNRNNSFKSNIIYERNSFGSLNPSKESISEADISINPSIQKVFSQRSTYDIFLDKQFGSHIAATSENVKYIRQNSFKEVKNYSKVKPRSPERLDSLDPAVVIQRGGLETPLRYVALIGNKNTPLKVLHRHLTAFRVAMNIFGPDFADSFTKSFIPYMGDNGISGIDAMAIALDKISQSRNEKLALLNPGDENYDQYRSSKPLPNVPETFTSKSSKSSSLKSFLRKSIFGSSTEEQTSMSSITTSGQLYADSVLEDELALEAVLCIKEIMKVESGYQAVISNKILILLLTNFLFLPTVAVTEELELNSTFRPSKAWSESLYNVSSNSLERYSVAKTAATKFRRNHNRRSIKANIDLRINIIEVLGPISVLSTAGHLIVMGCINDICEGESNKFGHLVNCLLDPFIYPAKVNLKNIYVSDDEDYMAKIWEFRIAMMVLINSLIISTLDIHDRCNLRKLFEAKGLHHVIDMLKSILPPTSLLLQFDTYLTNRQEDTSLRENTFRHRNEMLMSIGQICGEYSQKINRLKQPQLAENKIRSIMMYLSCVLDSLPKDDLSGDISTVGVDGNLDDDGIACIESEVVANDILLLLDRLVKTISLWCTSTAEAGTSTDPYTIGEMYHKMALDIVAGIEETTGIPVHTAANERTNGKIGELYEKLDELNFLYKQEVTKNNIINKDIEAMKVDLFRERHILNHITNGRIHSANSISAEEMNSINKEQKRRNQQAFKDSQKLHELLSKLKDYNLISGSSEKKSAKPFNEDLTKTLNDIISQVGLLNEVSQKVEHVNMSVKPDAPIRGVSTAPEPPSPTKLLNTIRRIKPPALIKKEKAKAISEEVKDVKETPALASISSLKEKEGSKTVNKSLDVPSTVPAPPPPPPPPLFNGTSVVSLGNNAKFTETLSGKKVLQTEVPMKNLQWQKISNSIATKTIWNDISEDAYENNPDSIIDLDLLTNLFGKETKKVEDEVASDIIGIVNSTNAPSVRSFKMDNYATSVHSVDDTSIKSKISIKKRTVHILEQQRAQNIEIVLNVIRKPYEEIRKAIITLNEDILTLDNLENLCMCMPTSEEVKLVKAYVSNENEELGNAEKFIQVVMDIPRLTQRLQSLIFYKSFTLELSEVEPDLDIVISACEEIKNSNLLKRLLQHVLVLGNYLNGSTFRGGARGFKIGSLLTLKETRASNFGDSGVQTLLHYLVIKLKTSDPQSLCYMEEMPHADSATRISVTTLLNSVKGLRVRCNDLKLELADAKNQLDKDMVNQPEDIKHDSNKRKDPFISLMDEFLPLADEKIKNLEAKATTAEISLTKLIEFYGEDIKDYDDSMEDFFSIFSSFSLAISKANSENDIVQERKQRKLERENNVPISKFNKSSTESSISDIVTGMLNNVRASVAPSESSNSPMDGFSDTSSEWSDRGEGDDDMDQVNNSSSYNSNESSTFASREASVENLRNLMLKAIVKETINNQTVDTNIQEIKKETLETTMIKGTSFSSTDESYYTDAKSNFTQSIANTRGTSQTSFKTNSLAVAEGANIGKQRDDFSDVEDEEYADGALNNAFSKIFPSGTMEKHKTKGVSELSDSAFAAS